MNTSEINLAVKILVEHMPHQPKAQILRELAVVVERVEFIPEAETMLQQADSTQLQSSLSYLFQNDVSTDMLQAILELHRRGISLVLGREYNSQLLQQCQEYLQEVREMRIITAIHISRSFEQVLASRFSAMEDGPIRVVFEVLPSLVGGCMIVSPEGRVVDYSFKTNVSFYTHRFLERKLKELQA